MTITETQKQAAIDAINELCESQLEYETSHRDAGYGYADLVGESWCNQKTLAMVKSFSDEYLDNGENATQMLTYKPNGNCSELISVGKTLNRTY